MQPGKWHKNIRNLTGHNNKSGDFDLPCLGNTTDGQANKLNEHFSSVCYQSINQFTSTCMKSCIPMKEFKRTGGPTA